MAEEHESVEVSTLLSDSDNDLVIVKKSRVKSVIWCYFGVKGDESGKPVKEDIDKPVCKLCKKLVPAKRSNTTNLFHHLQEHRPDAYSEIVPSSASKVTKRKQNSQHCNKLLAKQRNMIQNQHMPVSLIKPSPTTWLRICSLCMPWKHLDLRNLLQNLILSMPYHQETIFQKLKFRIV